MYTRARETTVYNPMVKALSLSPLLSIPNVNPLLANYLLMMKWRPAKDMTVRDKRRDVYIIIRTRTCMRDVSPLGTLERIEYNYF